MLFQSREVLCDMTDQSLKTIQSFHYWKDLSSLHLSMTFQNN